MSCNLNNNTMSFLTKLSRYYKENPGRCCDVTFIVGSQKEVVKTSRIILEVVCPEFIKLFDEKWGQSATNGRIIEDEKMIQNGIENHGIPLPFVEPQAFKLFLELLITDDVSVAALEKLTLSATDLLNVTELCMEYNMTIIQQNLGSLIQKAIFGNNFPTFAESQEFLKLSRNHLKTILSSDELLADETEIVQAVLKWAEFQCIEKHLEITGETMRHVLGDALFQIRFPTMSSTDFAKDNRLRQILTPEEQLDILRFLCLSDEDKRKATIAFCTRKRIHCLFSTVRFLKGFNISDDHPFVCDGLQKTNVFKVNQQITVHSVGFLGPVDADSFYDVTVEIATECSRKSCGKVSKRVLAKRNEIFYVSFDRPIVINPTYRQDGWSGEYYIVKFCLKGPNTSCPVLGSQFKDFRTEADGIGFYCQWYNYPMANFRFKKC